MVQMQPALKKDESFEIRDPVRIEPASGQSGKLSKARWSGKVYRIRRKEGYSFELEA